MLRSPNMRRWGNFTDTKGNAEGTLQIGDTRQFPAPYWKMACVCFYKPNFLKRWGKLIFRRFNSNSPSVDIFCFAPPADEPELSATISHAARPCRASNFADRLVQLPRELVAFGWRKFLETAVFISMGRQRALYVGGMFLNDAFDADFDQQRRASRPIPSGQSFAGNRLDVLGWAWLALGILCLMFLREDGERARHRSGHLHFGLQRGAQGHHGIAVADGLVPVLGLCHRRNRRGQTT